MLDPDEQRLFELLSVFSGATFEAVEEVASRVKGLEQIDVVDGLCSLVDKSLIRRTDHDDGGSRLLMLETLREFATARLDEDPELGAAARRAHAAHFADWTKHQWDRLTGDEREAASKQMVGDLDNIRTAWSYWVAERNFEQLGKFTDSLWLLYDTRGWYQRPSPLLRIYWSFSLPHRPRPNVYCSRSRSRRAWRGCCSP